MSQHILGVQVVVSTRQKQNKHEELMLTRGGGGGAGLRLELEAGQVSALCISGLTAPVLLRVIILMLQMRIQMVREA